MTARRQPLAGSTRRTASAAAKRGLHAILDAIDWLRREDGADREIKGHKDGYSTGCPGPALYAWVQAGAPRPSTAPATPAPQPKEEQCPRS
ncbi:hypothetical protein [Microtetraspora fusca]|uniref:hypothetical protein n=1 Tax=Microtetraspora fusca TaxID=1997 RepID=UPI00082B63CC|nr:hypothetical protein [Microtetraspora fusca]